METALEVQKDVVEEERTVIVQRRGLYAARDIEAGQVIVDKDIDVLISALEFFQSIKIIIGK